MVEKKPYKSDEVKLLHSIETEEGVENTDNLRYLGKLLSGADIPTPENDYEYEYSMSGGVKPTGKVLVEKLYEGGEVELEPVDYYPFYLGLGKMEELTDTNVFEESESGVTTKKLTPKERNPLTFTTKTVYTDPDRGNEDVILTFLGSVCTNFNITANTDGRLQTNLSFKALNLIKSVTDFSETYTEEPDDKAGWDWYNNEEGNQLTLEFDDGTNITVGRLREASYDIDLGVSSHMYVGSTKDEPSPEEHTYGKQEFNLSMTYFMDKPELFSKYLDNATFNINITLKHNITDDRLRIKLIDCDFESNSHNINEEIEPIEGEAEIKAEDIAVYVEERN